MKTATAFLIAVTVFASVFLESSAAPNQLFGVLGSNVGTSVRNLGNFAGSAIAGVGAGVDKVLGKAGELLKGILNKAVIDIKTLIQGVDKIVIDLKALLGGGTEAAAALLDEIVKQVEEVKSNVEELIKLDEKYDKAVAEGDVDSVKKLEGLIKIVAEKLKAIVPKLVKILDQISEKVGNEVARVIHTLKGILAKVVETVDRILAKIPEALKSKTTEVVNGDEKLDEDSLKEYVEEKIKINEAALAALLKAVELIVAEFTDVQKEDIAKFLETFVLLVKGTHEELWKDVEAKIPENRKKLMEKMSKVVENTEADVNKLMKTQDEEIKKVLQKYVLEIILPIAKDVGIEMNKSL